MEYKCRPGAREAALKDGMGIFAIYSDRYRTTVVIVASALIAVVAYGDYVIERNVSLGFLYFIPILAAAGFLNRGQLLALAAGCAILREVLSPAPWTGGSVTRIFVVFGVFAVSGLFIRELVSSRKRALEDEQKLLAEVRRRDQAETHLRMIIDSGPLAILTVDSEGRIQQANEAAHRLFGAAAGSLPGTPVKSYLPDLDNVPRVPDENQVFRTMMECVGRRVDGEPFVTNTWFSTYSTPTGRWTAAIVMDASQELRDREGASFESLKEASRILLASILHEVRNLSAAAAVAYSNLSRKPGASADEDLKVLGSLVKGLENLTSTELRISSNRQLAATDLRNVLNELRVVVEPSVSESLATIAWNIPENLPMVRGDHHALLQVFLNLAQNSLRALREAHRRELRVDATVEQNAVCVRFRDTGPGVLAPERLFQPFQLDSDGTGLGLHISRAIVRSFAGDLAYEPVPGGSCFAVHLATA